MNCIRMGWIWMLVILILHGGSVMASEREETIMGKVMVNEQFAGEIAVAKKDDYFVIPVTALLEKMGVSMTVQENGDVTFAARNAEYTISREADTIMNSASGWDVLQLPPGTDHLLVKEWHENEFLADSDTLRCFFVYYLRMQFSVNAAGEICIVMPTAEGSNGN